VDLFLYSTSPEDSTDLSVAEPLNVALNPGVRTSARESSPATFSVSIVPMKLMPCGLSSILGWNEPKK